MRSGDLNVSTWAGFASTTILAQNADDCRPALGFSQAHGLHPARGGRLVRDVILTRGDARPPRGGVCLDREETAGSPIRNLGNMER